jgi:hypothetical protein
MLIMYLNSSHFLLPIAVGWHRRPLPLASVLLGERRAADEAGRLDYGAAFVNAERAWELHVDEVSAGVGVFCIHRQIHRFAVKSEDKSADLSC